VAIYFLHMPCPYAHCSLNCIQLYKILLIFILIPSKIGLYFAIITQNIFLTTLLNSQYSWILDFGTVVLPSWLLLWASPSFRKQFFIDFLPKCVHQNMALSQQQVTTVKASKTIKVQSSTRNS
jgi:hypothetical protein